MLSEFQLHTGDPFADAALEKRLADSPEYWALIDYLEVRGVIDRADFLGFLSRSCTDYVKVVNRAHQSLDD